MSCPAGSSKIWGSQEAVDSAELTRVMPGIQHVRGHQANLYFLSCPCSKHFPYIPTPQLSVSPARVCVHLSARGLEASRATQQGQEARRKPCKGMASTRSISPHPYRKESLAHHSSSRTRVSCPGSFFARRRQRMAETTAPSPSTSGFDPTAVGEGRAPRTACHPPSLPAARAEPARPIPRLREAWHSRADNPNPQGLLNATALWKSPEPQSLPPLLRDTGKQFPS